jgi:peptidyl-prolyl cis-trans isomerase SurA
MPSMDLPPDLASKLKAKAGAKPARPATGTAAPSAPGAAEIPLENAPTAPVDPQPARGSLSPAGSPGPAASPAPSSEPGKAGAPSASAGSPPDATSPQIAALRPAPRSDPAIQRASSVSSGSNEIMLDQNWKEAGRAAARVGDEVITLHDLVLKVKDELKRHPPGRDLSREELNMVAKSVLAGLIERALVVQEAKRALKNPKQLERLNEAADKYWHDEEVPPLLRRYMVDNETQLKERLLESGRSLDSLRQSYRQDFLAQVFLDQRMSDRRKVELPEMLKYYNEHINDTEFYRPAVITWRELVVEKARHSQETEARAKAEALLARLKKGEDFAKLARAESEGPSRVREQGGLMQTSPGSYAVESVNQALGSLPLGQVSPVLEGPTSLHIILVENRRNAGPATFEEVQDQIRRKVMIDKLRAAREEFIAKLKRNALVSTIFDGTDSDPNQPDTQ